MFCSSEYRCIFVHVPKTGGTSINRTVKKQLPVEEVFGPKKIDMGLDPRRFGWEIKQRWASPEQWDGYVKFAFVRNPWDLVVSIYHNILQSERPTNLEETNEDKRIVRRELVSRFERQGKRLNFAGFIDYCVRNDALQSRFSYHWRPQYLHVTDPEDRLILDFVGRFEAFDRDWATIQRAVGWSIDLPFLNRSSHLDYRQYYTAQLRDIVARRFERDIDLFEYRF